MNLLSLRYHQLAWSIILVSLLVHTYALECEFKRQTVKAVPYIVNGILAKGYPFVVGVGGFKKCPPSFNWNLKQIGLWTIFSSLGLIPSIDCTGTIVHPLWVLTAAHCLLRICYPFILAGFPKKSLENIDYYFPATKIVLHEEYNQTGICEHDIGLIMVSKSFSTLNTTSSICLTQHRIKYSFATVAGFGRLSRNINLQGKLLREVVLLNGEKFCSDYFRSMFDIHNQTCAGIPGKGVARGDSGGPLFTSSSKQFVQIGIVSWDTGDIKIRWPTIFTRVSAYLSWIQLHTNNSICLIDCSAA